MRRMTLSIGLAVLLVSCGEATAPTSDEPLIPLIRAAAVLPATPTVVDLGTLGGTLSQADAINEAGQVVGFSSLASGVSHAFLWTAADGMQDLGTLGGSFSTANSINDLGQVVGQSTGPGFAAHAFLWSASTGMLDLGDLGGGYSLAYDVNNEGAVVGESWVPDEPNVTHAFLWTAAAGMRDLGTLGGSQTSPQAINDHGMIAGWYLTPAGAMRAFVWTEAGGFADIGTFGGTYAEARDVNNRGEVVGLSATATGLLQAFIWTKQGGMQPLPDLGGSTALYAINDNGEGTGRLPGPTGYRSFFLTSDHDVVVLNTLGGSASIGLGLNRHGQIVGNAHLASGEIHAALWTLNLTVTVAIDIKPGSDPNSVNVKANRTRSPGGGVLPVALLADGAIDVTDVDVATLRLGETTPVSVRGGGPLASLEDVDGDGDADLMLHFDVATLLATGALDAATNELCLTGSTFAGKKLRGCDAVRVVGS